MMTAVKTSSFLMIIPILGLIWSLATTTTTTTAFVAMRPFAATMHSSRSSSHYYRQQQQQQQHSTSTISLAATTSSRTASNDTDTTISFTPTTIRKRAAVVSSETVAGPWETSHMTTMTSRLSFLEERKRLLQDAASSSFKRPLIDPATVEICDSEEVNRRLFELEIIKNHNNGGEEQHQNQHLLDTGHNRRNADKTTTTADDSTNENSSSNKNKLNGSDNSSKNSSISPFALMMQQSARYIAQHWGKTVVFHIPGNLMEGDSNSSVDKLLGDLAQAWILGMKIVVVVGNRLDWDLCDLDATTATSTNSSTTATETGGSSNSLLQVTSEETLRLLEEEAGYWRTEVERKLNKCLHGVSHHAGHLEGNVVSGNFYTAKRVVAAGRQGRGKTDNSDSDSDDLYDYTGYAAKIHSDTIHRILHDNHDVVVLSTVGLCKNGNLINVNGYHLAASVAASLNAYKVVYMAHQGSVLQQKVPISTSSRPHQRHRDIGDSSSSSSYRVIQELPISCVKAITDYHRVRVHKQGFATFDHTQAAQHEQRLSPRDIELLLHMGWASWAVERGVTRAHIVNPTDGALLEELFTSKNGANTCIFHDRESLYLEDDDDDDEEEIYWRDDDNDDSAVTMTSSSQHAYGPVVTSPTAFAAKKSHGSSNNNHHYKNNNNKIGRNAAFLG
jgi:acetylglutamate kinase